MAQSLEDQLDDFYRIHVPPTFHAIYAPPGQMERAVFGWTPRPWPSEEPEQLPAFRNAPVPPSWSVVAVIGIDEPRNGRAVIATTKTAKAFTLMLPLTGQTYTPADILAGDLPKGCWVVWRADEA